MERVYHEAMENELKLQGIPFQTEVPFALSYGGRTLAARYRADLVCYDRVVVEIKAKSFIGRVERAQLENYLRCTEKPVGLLLNFALRSLEFYRLRNPANRG